MSLNQRLIRGGLIGAAIGMVFAFLAMREERGTLFLDVIWIPVILAAIGAGFVLSANAGEPFHLEEWAPLPVALIRQHAIRWYATAGWAFHGDTGRELSFRRSTLNTHDLGCLMLLSGLAAYFYLMGRRELTTTIILSPVPDGSEVEIIVSARGSGGQASAVAFFNSLHTLT